MDHPEPDRELVDRVRQGDAAAIGTLFSRYWRAARAAAFGMTGDLASAEDAAAEGFRQAWAGMGSLRDPDRFGPWLRTIVVRQARQAVRDRPADPVVPLDEVPDSSDGPDTALERVEFGALIHLLVRELPPRLREAVSLAYFEGYDADDAARFLEIPPGTLRRRLHEARSQLRHAADKILKGRRSMNERREREIERLRRLIDEADDGDAAPLYEVFRASLALRPAPRELIETLIRRHSESLRAAEAVADAKQLTQHIRESARELTRPSHRASDPNHPVGSIAAAIRRALPDFQEWTIDAGDAAAHFFAFTREGRDRLGSLPPGFDEGRPGAFLRATRALLFVERDSVRTTYQLLQDSADQQVFRAGMKAARMSDVIDLTWIVPGPLELRSVQDRLERLIADVLPGAPIRIAQYDEPRYRSALRLHVGDVPAPAATGGVLAEWPGLAADAGAAHLRLFLEPWASVRSGQTIDLDQAPAILTARRP